jgi:hypothetical protein
MLREDRTDHNRLSAEATRQLADKYIPAAGRQVTTVDNQPPEPIGNEAAVKSYATALMVSTPAITSAEQSLPLLSAFIADNPVFQNAEDLQKGGVWIESARKTLAALEDERKPKVEPLNAALAIINEPYRRVRQEIEGTKQAKGLLEILVDRWNAGEKAERKRREAIAEAARLEAEEAARVAQALIDQANDAIAAADVGACEDVGNAVIDAKAAIRDANLLDRTANRAEKETHVRVASQLGGRALAPRRTSIIVIDDLAAAIEAIGPVENILIAVRQSAKAFKEANGKLPKGCREDYTRSI